MNYKIFHDGELVNTIVASESFVTDYCEANGYTYEEVYLGPKPEPAPTLEDRMTAMEEAIRKGLSL